MNQSTATGESILTAEPVRQSDDEFLKSIGIDTASKPTEPKKVASASNLPSNLSLIGLSAASVVLGFFGALAYAKKQEGATLDKALLPRRGMTESGAKLAFRALGWGTLYAVSGFSVITYGLYEFTKYRLQQFEQRVQESKKAEPSG